MPEDPDRLAEAVCNGPDGFIVPKARHQTTIEDLEDASFAFDGSIGSFDSECDASGGYLWASVGCSSRPPFLELWSLKNRMKVYSRSSTLSLLPARRRFSTPNESKKMHGRE